MRPLAHIFALLAWLAPFVAAQTNAYAEPRAKPAPLSGQSYDFAYDGKDVGKPARAYLGRAYVHPTVQADANKPRPLVVFVHGLNSDLIKNRWMGGGNEGDIRRITDELIEAEGAEPFIIAAPSSVVPEAIGVARTSWPGFDLDTFVTLTEARLAGVATVDTSRVIVAGHSGGGCNANGGLATAAQAKLPLHALLAIDVCMDPSFATALAKARPTTHIVVAYQLLTWSKRPVSDFKRRFEQETSNTPAAPGVRRVLVEERPKEPMPHDAMVRLAFRKYLPGLLKEPPCAATASVVACVPPRAPTTSAVSP